MSKVMNMDHPDVLLVDDNQELVQLLAQRLDRYGVTAAVTYGGEEALRWLRQRPVEVVVLDVDMPGMDGLATLKLINQDHPEVAVILLTGHDGLEPVLHRRGLRVLAYLLKPVIMEELLYYLGRAGSGQAALAGVMTAQAQGG